MRLGRLALTGLALAAAAEAGAAWQAALAEDPRDGPRRCLLSSDPVTVDDGYTQTRARVVYDGEVFLLVADSPMDPAFGDLGLRVDAFPPVAPARFAGDRIAVFDRPEGLEQRFRRGAEASFRMRFWPTWPSEGPVDISFDLTGFSRALQQLQGCGGTG